MTPPEGKEGREGRAGPTGRECSPLNWLPPEWRELIPWQQGTWQQGTGTSTGWAGKGLLVCTLGYALGLLFCLGALEWWPHWVWSVCLFLPIQLWLLPLVFILPLSLWLAPRALAAKLCAIHAACILLVLLGYGRFQFFGKISGKNKPATPQSLTVVTNNIGQSNHQSMQPFLAAELPDLIALQDAANRGAAYTRAYPDRFVVGRGEFFLISKYPVLCADLIRDAAWNNQGVAARFELSFKGNPLVVYNVHLPTPRRELSKLRGKGLLLELLGRNRRRSDGRSYAESVEARREMVGRLLEVIQRETKPYIVVGDFNTPDHGPLYRRISSCLEDAFRSAGSGYGYSFPGTSSHALVLFGPWLRLDYLFAGKGWTPVYCRVEPNRRSQHRAVAARFEPRN